MNRIIAYPGSLPKSADFLNAQRNAMIAGGAILQAVFGTSAVASGFICSALAVPGMGVQVSAGALTQYTTVDATAYGELAADLTEFIVKQGINLDPATLSMARAHHGGPVDRLSDRSGIRRDRWHAGGVALCERRQPEHSLMPGRAIAAWRRTRRATRP